MKQRRLVEQDKVSVVLTAIEKACDTSPPSPPVALITASGEGKARGHFWAGQWTTKTGGARHEVMIAGEILAEGGISVMRTLLHEGAHAREVQDVSRGGRWHNKKFKEIAEEMGLVVESHKGLVQSRRSDHPRTPRRAPGSPSPRAKRLGLRSSRTAR